MLYKGRERSRNVEDRRGMKRPAAGVGILGIVIALLYLFIGKDPRPLVDVISTGVQQQAQTTSGLPTAESDELAEFVSVVLKDTEDVWSKLFADATGTAYRAPTLVLFDGVVASACGKASSSTGPFYCSADEKLYIDLSFYRDLKERFNAPGDFAMAYVVAHEVGHHVQHLLGITDQVHAMQGKISQSEYNELSVRLELQADFLAGVWAHHAQKMKNVLEENDPEEALNAANAIGDDRLQMQAQGHVTPDSFTHGTSEQRMRWFKRGFETGDLSLMDTFKVSEL